METWARYGEVRADASAPARGPRVAAQEARVALIAAVALAALGVLAGLLWSAGPRVHVVITAAGPDLASYGRDEFFAVDASFALISAALGVITALLAWFAARRWRGPVLLAGLVLGSLVGGIVMWRVGRSIGLAHYHHLLHTTDVGRRFTKPVDLRTHSALIAQPFFAALAYVLFAAWVGRSDLGRDRG